MPSPQSLALCSDLTGNGTTPSTTERTQAALVMKGSGVRVPASASTEEAAGRVHRCERTIRRAIDRGILHVGRVNARIRPTTRVGSGGASELSAEFAALKSPP
jgi:hypothetical protein